MWFDSALLGRVVAVVVIFGLVGSFLYRIERGAGLRAAKTRCADAYASARTAIDSARVDRQSIGSGKLGARHTCGGIRRLAAAAP